MKLSELLTLAYEYQCVIESDQYTEVKFGCDCGCGGDFYENNPEAWKQMLEDNAKALNKVVDMCNNLGIEYDGV